MDAAYRPSVRYVPGSWVAFAGTDVWLLAEMASGSPVITSCWEAIEQGAGVDHVLGIILREGLRNVPGFALAGRSESGMRVLVEGKARAELRMPGDDSDATLVTADGAPTWTERRVDGPIDLRLLSADEPGGTPLRLSLSGGVVLAAELTVGSVRPTPATAATPDPPIVASEGAVAPPRPVSPETLQAPVEGPTGERPSYGAPTLDHIVADIDMPPDMPRDMPPPDGPPIPDMPPPTMHVPGLIEQLPWQPQDLAEEKTGEIGPSLDKPWAPPAGPPADATSIAGLEGSSMPYTVERSASPTGPTGSSGPAEPAAPMVQAVACPNRHLNPPYAGQCRICGAPVAQQETFTVPRPNLGVLNLSTGDMVPLDRDIVLGRAPFHPDANAPSRPHLVQLASPGNDISRSHLRVTLDGWHVQVVDLGSINGTVVTLPGQGPVRLRAHDPFTIVPGTTISIADEVSARFDVPRP